MLLALEVALGLGHAGIREINPSRVSLGDRQFTKFSDRGGRIIPAAGANLGP